VWNALEHKILTAKDLSETVFDGEVSADAVRQVIRAMRDAGDAVETRPGRGYFRPDAPPS
jgi:hypothetical protein